MRKSGGLCAMFLVGSMVLGGSGLRAQAMAVIQSRNCPVQFSADRWGGGTVEYTGGKLGNRDARGIFLRFLSRAADSDVTSVTAIVHGSLFTLHVEPVRASGPRDLTETFHLTAAVRDRQGHWKLTTDKVPLVTEIEITAIGFADGTAWKETPNAQCRVLPSDFLLVARDR